MLSQPNLMTSQQQPDPDQPGCGRVPRRHPPPVARPAEPELISDLHARREWFADRRAAASGWLRDYLTHEWYDREARQWAAADIGADAALMWRELGLQPSEAADLQREGFVPEQVSARWRSAGIPAEEIAEWIGAGLTPEEARAQRALGVTAQDAGVMRRLRNLGAS
jgi:hypothetical protein